MVVAMGSSKTNWAVSKSTLCFRQFASSLTGSQNQTICSFICHNTTITTLLSLHNLAAQAAQQLRAICQCPLDFALDSGVRLSLSHLSEGCYGLLSPDSPQRPCGVAPDYGG